MKGRKSIILGESMFKHLNDWEMSKIVNAELQNFFKYFSSATTSCMEDYIKLSLQKDLNHFLLQQTT